jgi:uncharacterized membrane protein YczE
MNLIFLILQCMLIGIGVFLVVSWTTPFSVAVGVFNILLNMFMLLTLTLPAIKKELRLYKNNRKIQNVKRADRQVN